MVKPFTFIAAMLFAAQAFAHEDDAKSSGQVLGKVSFKTSCSKAMQPKFNRGVALLHSFWYTEAEAAFKDIVAQEPGCTIAYWGLASILMNNPIAGQGAVGKAPELAQAALEQARANPPKTQRERDYLEAVSAYYKEFAQRTERERQQARAEAYEKLAAKYPADDEAQIFYAVYLAATQSLNDKTYGPTLKAAGILEQQFKKYPQHPGVAHYLIHSYDYPPIAQKGVSAARRYAKIAPDAPHAQHMPSHIFTRVGYWEDAVQTNARSAAAARKGNEGDESWHAVDYMVYAYLQMGRDRAGGGHLERRAEVHEHHAALRRALCHRGDPGAAGDRAWRLEGGGGARATPDEVSIRRREHASRARPRQRPQRQPGRRRAGAAGDAQAARAAGRGQERLLGHGGRGERPGRGGLDPAGAGQGGRGRGAHAPGRGPGRQERQAHRHPGPHRCRRASCSATCCWR